MSDNVPSASAATEAAYRRDNPTMPPIVPRRPVTPPTSEITASRAAELVVQALARSATAMRRQAQSRQLIGELFAGVRAGYRAKAAEFESMHLALCSNPDARWEVGSAIVAQVRLSEARKARELRLEGARKARPEATTDEPEQLLTPEDVAGLLKLTRRFVYELMHEGEFGELVRVGPKAVRITETGYRAYIERTGS